MKRPIWLKWLLLRMTRGPGFLCVVCSLDLVVSGSTLGPFHSMPYIVFAVDSGSEQSAGSGTAQGCASAHSGRIPWAHPVGSYPTGSSYLGSLLQSVLVCKDACLWASNQATLQASHWSPRLSLTKGRMQCFGLHQPLILKQKPNETAGVPRALCD